MHVMIQGIISCMRFDSRSSGRVHEARLTEAVSEPTVLQSSDFSPVAWGIEPALRALTVDHRKADPKHWLED